MIKIETIAATKEINNMTAQQLNDEQTFDEWQVCRKPVMQKKDMQRYVPSRKKKP